MTHYFHYILPSELILRDMKTDSQLAEYCCEIKIYSCPHEEIDEQQIILAKYFILLLWAIRKHHPIALEWVFRTKPNLLKDYGIWMEESIFQGNRFHTLLDEAYENYNLDALYKLLEMYSPERFSASHIENILHKACFYGGEKGYEVVTALINKIPGVVHNLLVREAHERCKARASYEEPKPTSLNYAIKKWRVNITLLLLEIIQDNHAAWSNSLTTLFRRVLFTKTELKNHLKIINAVFHKYSFTSLEPYFCAISLFKLAYEQEEKTLLTILINNLSTERVEYCLRHSVLSYKECSSDYVIHNYSIIRSGVRRLSTAQLSRLDMEGVDIYGRDRPLSYGRTILHAALRFREDLSLAIVQKLSSEECFIYNTHEKTALEQAIEKSFLLLIYAIFEKLHLENKLANLIFFIETDSIEIYELARMFDIKCELHNQLHLNPDLSFFHRDNFELLIALLQANSLQEFAILFHETNTDYLLQVLSSLSSYLSKNTVEALKERVALHRWLQSFCLASSTLPKELIQYEILSFLDFSDLEPHLLSISSYINLSSSEASDKIKVSQSTVSFFNVIKETPTRSSLTNLTLLPAPEQ